MRKTREDRCVVTRMLIVALALLAATSATADARVILVTLDGARWQDVYQSSGALYPDEQLMPALWKRIAAEGAIFRGVTSSKAPVSLPGYLALLMGPTACADNDCGRATEETLPERIARELALPPTQVAVFASWSKLALAAVSTSGARVHVDAPPDGPSRKRANGGAGPPWENARWDDETAALALAHLGKFKPRFLHLALLDMDEQAHARDARATADAMRFADRTLAKIFAFIDALPPEERARTTVLVTADHGRGPGPLWFDHRAALPSSRDIFLVALGAQVHARGRSERTITQANVRPTIEALLGLAPLEGPGRGAPLSVGQASPPVAGARPSTRP